MCYSRKLRTVNPDEIYQELTIFNIYKIINLWSLFKIDGKGGYNLSWKNCKTLARTITYFAY